ncbi:hypothetical protein CY34DRAFT_15364 [Suillus luteus UH-Slu-Lm8-n1]|uniref:Uncharacterized protein n=1 Tax=Suillus luteus UH-Slu-Lm8-n1 TaxID=930992 RepID=A0A0D0AUC9_9AGAM|nr:hypothetical protein CY34DRAFT_15364 [Suillus luteus UH-Slu-Lm8-n1]
MSIVFVTLAVPMKNNEDVCQSLFDVGVICLDCVRSRTWLVPVETIGSVAHVTLKRQFWTSVDAVQNQTKLRNDCKELDEDGYISDDIGRQGEKAAGLKGFLISKPLETLPRYAAPPTSAPSRSSRSASPQPRFTSSGSAI